MKIIWLGLLFNTFFAHPLIALPTVVPEPVRCLRDLESNFFKEQIVSQALSLYNIRQELWVPINNTLRRKSFEVLNRMKKRTAYMVPNPIEYPIDREKTAQILIGVLFEVFLEAMAENYANERPTSDFVFDYILKQNMPFLTNCFGKEVIKLQP